MTPPFFYCSETRNSPLKSGTRTLSCIQKSMATSLHAGASAYTTSPLVTTRWTNTKRPSSSTVRTSHPCHPYILNQLTPFSLPLDWTTSPITCLPQQHSYSRKNQRTSKPRASPNKSTKRSPGRSTSAWALSLASPPPARSSLRLSYGEQPAIDSLCCALAHTRLSTLPLRLHCQFVDCGFWSSRISQQQHVLFRAHAINYRYLLLHVIRNDLDLDTTLIHLLAFAIVRTACFQYTRYSYNYRLFFFHVYTLLNIKQFCTLQQQSIVVT